MADARGRHTCIAAVLLIAGVPAAAQHRGNVPTFGIDVEVVSLSLAITDPQGHPVIDVSEQDVAVFEDGVRQPLSLFAHGTWPISLSVLIDGSDSMNRALPVAQAAALRLLKTLGPRDRAQVAQFSRRLTVLQEPTSDATALENAVHAVQIDGDTALYDALYVALKDLAREKRDAEPERRALVVLSDGVDTASMVTDEQVLELAREAEVGVYAIGLRDQRPTAPPEPLPTYFLTALARETGGRVFLPSSLADLDGVYDRIATELRTLYEVAYVSDNPARDGGWRKISVRTLRPNLLVRHRAGYPAARASRLAHGR